MTATQFNAATAALGCAGYEDTAELLGIGVRSVARYAVGAAPVPAVVSRLIDMLQRHGVPRAW